MCVNMLAQLSGNPQFQSLAASMPDPYEAARNHLSTALQGMGSNPVSDTLTKGLNLIPGGQTKPSVVTPGTPAAPPAQSPLPADGIDAQGAFNNPPVRGKGSGTFT